MILVILIIVGVVYAGTQKKEVVPKSSGDVETWPVITLEGTVTWGLLLSILGLAIRGWLNEGPAVYAPPIGVINGMYPPLNFHNSRKRK